MTETRRIDLNCDLGESFGAWRMGDDAALLGIVSSANIACGFHAGDPDVMRGTVALAVEHGVAIGAHVALPDLQGFGRREMSVAPSEVYAMTLYQLGALHGFARAAGARVAHVKAHGALYTMAARERPLADAIAQALRDFDPTLLLVGLAGSALLDAGRHAGLRVAAEAFADRRYRADGSLQPRRKPDALIHDQAQAVAQACAIARGEPLHTVDGTALAIAADTLCLHGDGTQAVRFAQALRETLEAGGVRIAALAESA